jgi:hypothetical protein
MILGKGCSRSLSVSQYKLVKGKFVFFLDEGACDWFWKAAPSRVGYDMKDEDLVFAPPPTGPSKNLNTTTAWIFPRCWDGHCLAIWACVLFTAAVMFCWSSYLTWIIVWLSTYHCCSQYVTCSDLAVSLRYGHERTGCASLFLEKMGKPEPLH